MMRKLVTVFVCTLLLLNIIVCMFSIHVVGKYASGIIYIRADGSIEPVEVPISSSDNVTYTFFNNISNYEIVVEKNNTIIDGAGFTLQGFVGGTGFNLTSVSNVTIKNVNINGFSNGIRLENSVGNSIYKNNMTTSWMGIWIIMSLNSSINENNVTGNFATGIELFYSPSSTLRNNKMMGNQQNFDVSGDSLEDFLNDVDSSNTVDNKPIYYWINVYNNAVPLDAGNVILVNCSQITVENLNLTKNSVGIHLVYTKNSIIRGNYAGDNGNGISMSHSQSNNIFGNNLTNNINGIYFHYSTNNTVYENNIMNNYRSVWLYAYSNNNKFYHNNFINNQNEAQLEYSIGNIWDDDYPSGGNYWSDYTGVDLDHDGIDDTEYVIDADNIDHHPLMGMFSDFYATSEHHVQTICNSSITDFQFNGTAINFHVSGENDTTGFCRICIPTALMNVTYKVYVNGTEVAYNLLSCSNETRSYLYFNYTHSTQQVIIVPEFSSSLILPLFTITTLVKVILCRRKQEPYQKTA